MDIAKDIYDTFSDDLDPQSPVPEGEEDKFPRSLDEYEPIMDQVGTSDDPPETPQEPNDENEGVYRTRFGRKITPVMRAAMCCSEPTPISHVGKHKHFQYHAGGERMRKVRCGQLNDAFIHGLDWDPSTFLMGNSVDSLRVLSRLVGKVERGEWDPLALSAKSNSVDTFTYNEAMNGPNKDGFEEAARIELMT